MTRSVCEDYVPNAWVYYIDAKTGEILHLDEYFDEHRDTLNIGRQRPAPPGGWTK